MTMQTSDGTVPSGDNRPLRLLKAVVFTVAGVGLMVAAVWSAASTWRFVAHAVAVPGTVIRLNAGGAHPEVRFTTATNQVIDYPQGGMIWGYRVGDQVTVLYDPNDPAQPIINTRGALWGFTAMNFLLGAVFVVAAQLLWRERDLVK